MLQGGQQSCSVLLIGLLAGGIGLEEVQSAPGVPGGEFETGQGHVASTQEFDEMSLLGYLAGPISGREGLAEASLEEKLLGPLQLEPRQRGG